MFIFATNHPFKLDQAVLSRIGERIEFKLPELAEREKILKMYIDRFAEKMAIALSQDLSNNITSIASKLEGISPREIEYIAEKMVQTACMLKNKGFETQITLQIAMQTTDLMKAEIQKINAWSIEKKNWIEKMMASTR